MVFSSNYALYLFFCFTFLSSLHIMCRIRLQVCCCASMAHLWMPHQGLHPLCKCCINTLCNMKFLFLEACRCFIHECFQFSPLLIWHVSMYILLFYCLFIYIYFFTLLQFYATSWPQNVQLYYVLAQQEIRGCNIMIRILEHFSMSILNSSSNCPSSFLTKSSY